LTKEDEEEVLVASTRSPAAAPVVLEVRKMPGLRLNEKQEVIPNDMLFIAEKRTCHSVLITKL
jgi:hypothetical protein